MFLAPRQFRLARGPDKSGLRCDADGLSADHVRGRRNGSRTGERRQGSGVRRDDQYSDIFFNRSFSTISNGRYSAPFRADVVGLRRPSLDPGGEYDVYEVLSPRQSGPAREQVLRPAVPGGIRSFESRAYKLLLKLLRALGLS